MDQMVVATAILGRHQRMSARSLPLHRLGCTDGRKERAPRSALSMTQWDAMTREQKSVWIRSNFQTEDTSETMLLFQIDSMRDRMRLRKHIVLSARNRRHVGMD